VELDQNRLRAIIDGAHSFYGNAAEFRNDNRLHPGTGDFILAQVQPDMRVLDVGCGDGATLIRGHNRFAYGLGIENDPEHIRMAEDGLKASGAANVEFRLLDFGENAGILEPESFDFVFSQRGPLDSRPSIRTALSLLRPDGLLLSEQIGKHHLQEVSRLFEPASYATQMTLEKTRAEMERNGLDIRIVADLFSKRIYPDVYQWLRFQCGIWSWLGEPLPEPDDPRIRLFAEQNASPSGEIMTTHHVTWTGGLKRQWR
jgi:SAM-dependent methyltransferase